jgi:hypothetical protein
MRRHRRRVLIEELETRLCLDGQPTLLPGTPFGLPPGNWTPTPFVGSPIFADLNGDGRDELIAPVAGGRLVAYTFANGAVQQFQTYETGATANIKTTPIVVTVPGAHKAIFAALGRDEAHPGSAEDGRVFGWDAVTGQVLPGWPQSTGRTTDNLTGVTGPLASGDLNGDGVSEIVVTSFSHFVTAFHLDGSIMWTYNADDTIESGAVVGDLDKDGKNEVVFGSDSSQSPYFQNGGFINILDSSGSAKFRYHVGEVIWSSPILADLQGTGYLDIVVGTGLHYSDVADPNVAGPATVAGNGVYALDYQGHVLPGWPYVTADASQKRSTYPSPAVADLQGDGHLEVIEEDRAGFLHIIQASGQPLPGWAGGRQIVPPGQAAPPDTYASPIIADINGDGRPDIIASAGVFTEAFDAQGNRTDLIQFNFPGARLNAPAVGRFTGGDGLVLAFTGNSLAQPGAPALVTMYQLPASPLTPPWPMLRRSADGTALAYSSAFVNFFVNQTYGALLGRAPHADELANAMSGLLTNQQSPRQFAISLAGTGEGKGHLGLSDLSEASITSFTNSLYQTAFGLPGTPADSLAAALYDLHHGVLATNVAAGILASGGNYASTNAQASWIRSVFRDVLVREATPDDVAAGVRQLDSGVTMPQFAQAILNSTEARIQYVREQYIKLLGRDPGPAGAASLAGYARREDVVVFLVSSAEYLARNGGTTASYVQAAYRDIIGLVPVPADALNYWISQIDGTVQKHSITGVRELKHKMPQRAQRTRKPPRHKKRHGPHPTPTPGVDRSTLASQLVNSVASYGMVVVADFFRYLPDETQGVLRTGNGNPTGGVATNPTPAAVASFTAQLQGGARDEDVIAAMLTAPQYLERADYHRGFFRSIGVRA